MNVRDFKGNNRTTASEKSAELNCLYDWLVAKTKGAFSVCVVRGFGFNRFSGSLLTWKIYF